MAIEKDSQAAVNYRDLDPSKIILQQAAASTARNLEDNFGYHEVAESRGESAYVWWEGDKYQAMVIEGLGTKNLVADELFKQVREASVAQSQIANEMSQATGKTYYDAIGQDAALTII